jgi:hypothetical protein
MRSNMAIPKTMFVVALLACATALSPGCAGGDGAGDDGAGNGGGTGALLARWTADGEQVWRQMWGRDETYKALISH